MMYFCFLAKIVSFQKVAQNLSSRLKRATESCTQQHTMSQFSSLEKKGVTYTKLRVRSIGKSGFRFWISDFGFPNKTRNPKMDF